MSFINFFQNFWNRYFPNLETLNSNIVSYFKTNISPTSFLVGIFGAGLVGLYVLTWKKEQQILNESGIPDPEDDSPASHYKREKRREHQKKKAKENLEKVIMKDSFNLKPKRLKRKLKQENEKEALLYGIEKKESKKTTQDLINDFQERKKQEIKEGYDQLLLEATKQMNHLRFESDPSSIHINVRTSEKEQEKEKQEVENYIQTHLLPKTSTPNQKLIFAMEIGDIVLARTAINDGASINYRDNDGYTPLHHASLEKFLTGVDFCLKVGGKINALDKNSRTPLHLAALSGDVSVVKRLIDSGAKQMKDRFGNFPEDLIKNDPEMRPVYKFLKHHPN